MNQVLETAKLSLIELQKQLKQGIEEQFPRSYWVVAEINSVSVNASGHCYLELVQKDETASFVQAKMSATIWAYSFRMIRSFFETSTGQRLSQGLKVLVKGGVQYHELYGLSLNITDIEPSYTVGELELQRRKTIQQLKDDGVFDMNRELQLPLLPQRVAVISSPTAAGYQDFMQHLHSNPYGYTFHTTLFAAQVQGQWAEESLLSALDILFARLDEFDVAVLIRGGGSQTDLLCFDSYRLASHLAQLPIPVLTGIGHDRDESVADMVAHTMLKTPTAVADFLVEQLTEREQELNELADGIAEQALALVADQNDRINELGMSISSRLAVLFERERQQLEITTRGKLTALLNARFRAEEYRLGLLEKSLEAVNPQQLLSMGYAIVTQNGRRITDAAEVKTGDVLQILLAKGSINVRVE